MTNTDMLVNLQMQLDEWHRKLDSLNHSYDKIRERSIGLLAIQFGFAGFVLTQLNHIVKGELYGIAFFIFGAVLFVVSVLLTASNYTTKLWSSPMYKLEIEKMNSSQDVLSAYGVLIEDYKSSYEYNLKVHEPSTQRLNKSVYLFAATAIIILTLMLA